MYQRAYARQEWADIFEECTNVTQTVPATMWLVTTARHPDLGTVVGIEDEQAMVMVYSENPPEARDPSYRLDEAA